jgi:hypothetical protein
VRGDVGTVDKTDLKRTAKIQGLKPVDSVELIGTTEVVPFHKTISTEVFIKLRWLFLEEKATSGCGFGLRSF